MEENSPELLAMIERASPSFGPVLGAAFNNPSFLIEPDISQQDIFSAGETARRMREAAPQMGDPLPLSRQMGENMQIAPQGFQEGGEVEQMMMMAEGDPNAELAAAIDGLMAEQAMAEDPEEQAMFESMAENVVDAANAPMADMVQMIAAEGRGGDTTLAHLTPGEVVLPVQAMQDPDFETAVENRFNEIGLDPEQYVVGAGIASLNPMTGLEEFGFFKKVGKFLKKAAKVVAPIAMLVPGVGTAVGAALGGIGGLAGKAASAVIGKTATGAIGSALSTGLKGVASLGIPGVSPIAGGAVEGADDFVGTLGQAVRNPLAGGVFGARGSTYAGADKGDVLNRVFRPGLPEVEVSGSGVPITSRGGASALEQQKMLQELQKAGITQDEFDQLGNAGMSIEQIYSTLLGGAGEAVQGQGKKETGIFGGTLGPTLRDTFLGSGDEKGKSGILGLLGLGGKGDLGKLGLAGGAAYMLGKLAKEEAERDKGVPMVPLTTMDASGRYNIEAEIARRMGRQAPNPVEFGLQPRFPTMVTRATGPARVSQYYDPNMPDYDPRYIEQQPPIQVANGGAIYPMAYANGGNVAMEDFERMNGGIDGPGTETSDDIPAMLSDGEFVMTGQAVRGAGSFELNEQPDGILALVPSSSEDRERGTQLMYQMMNAFERYANATN